MKLSILIEDYIHWHYGQAFKDVYHVWMNFIQFFFNFFSITTLLATLIAPWKRMDESYPKGFSPTEFIQTMVVNVLMRFVGLFVRLIIVGIGLTLASFTFLFGAGLLVLWAFVPVLIVIFLIAGLTLLVGG